MKFRYFNKYHVRNDICFGMRGSDTICEARLMKTYIEYKAWPLLARNEMTSQKWCIMKMMAKIMKCITWKIYQSK